MFGNDISQVAAQAREFERSGKRDKFLEESANAVYDDGEGRQLFPVEIDPAMDRYLRQKGEGWQADAYRSWQRGKMLAADLRKGGDDPMKAEKERVLGEERAKVQEYVNERTRRGMPLFPDALAFKSAQEDEAEYARRKDKVDWHRSVFNGDLKKVPESVKKEFEAQFFPDNELGDELRARSLVLGWALDEGGYTENQVSARNGVPLLEQMAIRLKEQGEQIDFNKPGLTVYRFLSRRAQEDAHADELLKGAAESVRQAVLTGGDGRQALWEQRGQMGEDMYKKVGNTLRWVKADAERTRRGLEPVLPRVMEGLEWAVKYADGTANRIFQPEGMASIHQALKAMDGLTDAQMDALAEIVQRKGGNERSYMANVWKAGNRGWEDLGNGIRSLLRGGIAAQLDVAGGVKELFGGDGSALKADAKAADEYGRRLDAFLAMAQGTYRPINKPEYGWFGNGVLSAVRSVPITALSFSGVGAGVAAMSYAGDSYSKAVQERPDGGRLARLGGAAASGAVQGALDRAGAIVAKGVMGLRSGSAFVDKWMSKLSLSRQAMRLKSSALRAGARSGVAGGMVLGEEMTTEKLQDLADPVMQSLASVMAGEAPGIDWERFWKDFTNRDQNMELFGSVLAFALVGAGARFTAEAGMQRQLSREYGKLKRTFGFSDSLLARMRAEESDVARYAMMQDGIQDFMRRNYGQEVDGVKVGLGDRDGMRKLAARGGVRTMDVVAAAEAHAAETARGVDEVRVDGAEVQDGKGAVVDVKGPESGGVSEVGSGPVLSFEHGPVPERKGRRQADEKEAMREYVKAVNEQLKEFGASPIREEMNEFTEEMQYVVELGDRPEFYDTYDDAYEAVLRHLEEREDEVVAGLKSSLRQYRDKDEGYVGRVQDEANEEMMQHLSDVGQDGRMSFDRSKLSVPMTLAQLKTQGDFMRKSAEGRERIYAAQMGVEAGVDAARLRVYGANVAQEFANGRYEVVSRLYRGANPFDVYEEWTEGMTKVLIKDNEWTVAEFEDELKRLEGATGETFLATGEGVDRLQAVCEGVSKAARAHLMGHISDERLPDKLRRWFKMFALLFAKYFEFAQDVMLAKKMLGADVQGKMSEKFRRLLNDFAGFDEAAIAERARREEQAQIEAEAMGDVPEIGEWVAGRLPHPKTAAEAGSDLTGELQRIYDALTTTRTAKGRRRKDGTLGKSFEQRVVARAEQFFSREGRVSDVLEAANEAGFDFADSGELLSAVYDSVVYGYKRYAARGEGQEVSFSMGDRVRRVPMAEARRVADAFHRVEGMEPVAADVPAAYASDLKDALGDIRERYRVLQKETQEQGYALVMGDGKRVQVGGKGWREVKQHAADRRVLAALAVLPELAGRAEFIYSGENSDLKRKPNIARFHYYLTKADFKGASGDGSADLAYVNIAVAEGKNGELFYDLDASTVEDVDSMKGTSATLQRPRVPNTGEAGDGVPHKGRVALLKEFVNYVDRDLAGQGREGREVSVQDVEAQGGFDEHGVLAAENAVVVKPDGDVTMSVRALHASPHSFRKFDTAFMGKGEGNQAYGWGLYFATNPKVNRHYLDQFKTVLSPPTLRFRDMDSRDMNTWAKVFTDYFLADNSEWDPEIVRKEIASYFKPSHIHHFANQENLKRVSQNIVNNTNLVFPEESSRSDSVKIGLEFNQWLLDHLDEIEIRPGMSSSSNYKVELNVDDSVLLDWDRPFSEQSETVKEALAGELAQRVGCTKEVALESLLMEGRRFTGQQIYVGLCEGFARDWEKGMKKASLALRKFGIKGIRYADGYTRGKAEEEQTYNYVIFDGNDIKITAFADESTGGAWADYEDPTASFSLATRESVWVTLEREAQKNRLEVLRSQTAKALETWRRVCAANDVKQGDGAEAFGRVMAVVASIYKTLPEGYRFGLYPYMRAAENLATRLEDGQAWLSDELKKETLMDDTSERMDAVIDKLLARTLEQADRYAVDQMRAEMVARIKAVQPTKKASGKFNKGKLSAEDYRHLHGIVAMMNTDQEAKEKRMLELEGVLSSNQSTEEERGAAELELKDWHTFGYLAGMGLEQTRACARALALFITTGRTAWSTRLDEERRRTKFKAEKIVEGLGQATPQGGRDAEEDAKASTRTKAAKYLKYGLQSYSQLLNGWKKIPALRGLAHAEVTAIAEANVALRNMKHARDREVTALVKRCFGVQRTKDVARVLSDFKKTGDSGVVLNPLVKVERTVRIAEAREWVGLSFEEREERRKAIRKEYNDRGLSDDKASVPEALIPEMRRQLAELDELVKAGDGRARRRKNITAKEEVVRPGRKGETLKVSRAQAMYAILLYEQAEYVETMRNEGIGEAEVARLREFVGAEGLAFGYGLRELMNRQGKLLARVYEEREGVPFPAVENYFRAVFRADHKLDTKASFGEQTNAVAGGAKYGMLIPRRKHNLHLAWNMDCEAVFQAASAEVENYICTADITARWRGILADKEAAASLKEHMGRHGIDSLRHWLDVIDGAGVMEGGALLAGAQATSRFQSAKAVALLAWNVLTMLKQTSGLMHGMFAGEVGMGSFLLHLGQTMSMTGRMGVFEVMKTEAFRARTNDAQAELVSQLMGYASDQNYTGAIRFSMAGMRAIEKMDVWSNAVSMAALYNAKWAELEEAGKRTGVPMTDDEMHALCMQSVTRALELVAQPLTQSQKSMLGASTGLFAKMACFMSSEVLNKVGMIVSHVSSGNWGQALALYGMMSVAEQTVIALWHALLDDEDEWEKNGGWFGAMLGAPVAMIGGVPMLGAAVEFGYKQATGQRIYAGTASGVIDYSAIYRAAKNTWKAVTGEKEMTFADWAELILLDAKAAAYVAGAGAGSRSKAADSVASWLLSVAGVANLSKPGFKLAE